MLVFGGIIRPIIGVLLENVDVWRFFLNKVVLNRSFFCKMCNFIQNAGVEKCFSEERQRLLVCIRRSIVGASLCFIGEFRCLKVFEYRKLVINRPFIKHAGFWWHYWCFIEFY